MVEVTEKSLLTREPEAAYLTPECYETGTIPVSTSVIVDFISFIRGEVIKPSMYPTFGHPAKYLYDLKKDIKLSKYFASYSYIQGLNQRC